MSSTPTQSEMINDQTKGLQVMSLGKVLRRHSAFIQLPEQGHEADPVITAVTTDAEAAQARGAITVLRRRSQALGAAGLRDDVAELDPLIEQAQTAIQTYESDKARKAGTAAMAEVKAIAKEARALEAQYADAVVTVVELAEQLRQLCNQDVEQRRLVALGFGQSGLKDLPERPRDPNEGLTAYSWPRHWQLQPRKKMNNWLGKGPLP
jgi:hypothetical protein